LRLWRNRIERRLAGGRETVARAQQTFERFFAAGLNAGAIGDEIGTARGADRVALFAGRLLRRDRMDPKDDQNENDQQQKGKRQTIHRASSLEISSSQMVEARTTQLPMTSSHN
jgi:hypothetical protein